MIPADQRTGTTVGKYRLHEIVGRGGMGVVYRAEHVYIGREVALKILHEGYGGREESIKRFLREARAASLINHPNIVEVTDFGKAQDGTVFFVMELLLGEPLDAVLAHERRLDLLRAITICNQMTAALAAAHSKGIIHRDLKPENVMLMPREGRRELVRRVSDESGAHEISEREKNFDFVKILDFGVAKVREPDQQKGRVTQNGVVFGTPEYMAPETARVGFSDVRSDVYALGVMFYEMLTGSVPFTGEAPVDVMLKQVNEKVPPLRHYAPDAEITEETERMILKALAKDPELRHQSMEEFHRDLQKCYGQVRFRRTLRTPAAHAPAAAATIQLTKRKPQQGAIPNGLMGGGSVSIEVDPPPASRTPPPALRTPPPAMSATTPAVGAAAARMGAPVLLTKKKERPARAADPAELQVTPPPLLREPAPARSSAATSPPRADRAAEPEKKRKTLPLGVDGGGGFLGRMPASPAPLPPEDVSPPTPKIPARTEPGAMKMSSPPRPESRAVSGSISGADRPTPRVPMRATPPPRKPIDAPQGAPRDTSKDSPEDDSAWIDDPTLPGMTGG